MHNALMSRVLDHNLLSHAQFGFRPGSSTQALLALTDNCHNILKENASAACIFFDLSKALPHHLIMDALIKVGVTGQLLCWFGDYLSYRSQRVVLEGESSSLVPVTSGVPQGSILGPLLFIITVDSLTKLSLSSNAALISYADDFVLYKSICCPEDRIALQDDVNKFVQYVRSKNLKLNVDQCSSHVNEILIRYCFRSHLHQSIKLDRTSI